MQHQLKNQFGISFSIRFLVITIISDHLVVFGRLVVLTSGNEKNVVAAAVCLPNLSLPNLKPVTLVMRMSLQPLRQLPALLAQTPAPAGGKTCYL